MEMYKDIHLYSLRNDKEVVLAVVNKNGFELEHTSNSLRNDKEIVLETISENGYALQIAS